MDSIERSTNKPRKKVVLVVEDQPDIREVLSVYLKSWGYVVLSADNAADALAATAQSDRLDIVLTDVFLPAGLNGIDLVHELRAAQICQDFEVIFMSGQGLSVTNDLRQAGKYSRLLRKPFAIGELETAISEALTPPSKHWLN